MKKREILNKIYGVEKPVIGMLHIDDLLGAPDYKGLDYLIKRAKKDIQALQGGGIDGILIENWKEDSIGEFVSQESAVCLSWVVQKIVKDIKVPFGINVLNNDYKVAFSLAKLSGASFVELDVFVDHVVSDFVHSPIASKNPFEINVNLEDIHEYAKKIGASDVPLFVFVQPKHYKLIDKGKTIEKSVTQAISSGASAVLITKATGTAPTVELIEKAKLAANGKVPVGIGSGFSSDNAIEYLSVADFAIVGTSIKIGNNADNPVDGKKVEKLMKIVKKLR